MNSEENWKREEQAADRKAEVRQENERRLEALMNINNRYVRTARHLEQNSDITRLDRLKYSLKIQEEREAQMENLKNIIAHGIHEEVDMRRNTKRNLEFTDHYLQHHADHMDSFTLEKAREKQEHRKEQLRFLD